MFNMNCKQYQAGTSGMLSFFGLTCWREPLIRSIETAMITNKDEVD